MSETKIRDIEKSVAGLVDAERLTHILSTRDMAVEIAEILRSYGVEIDPISTEAAALLHDVTKCMNQCELCKKYALSLSEDDKASPAVLHSLTGAYYARENYSVSEEVFSAIKNHTLGEPGMALLDRIIFAADYCERTRRYPECICAREKIMNLAGNSSGEVLAYFDKIILEILENTVSHLKEQGRSVHCGTVATLEYFRQITKDVEKQGKDGFVWKTQQTHRKKSSLL